MFLNSLLVKEKTIKSIGTYFNQIKRKILHITNYIAKIVTRRKFIVISIHSRS